MEKENYPNIKVMDALCPHCRSSFVQKGKIINHFKRTNGEIGVISESMIPGEYAKIIQKEFGEKISLEKKEKVRFFCQFCEKDLHYRFNDNIFEMLIEVEEKDDYLPTFRSALNNEEFTAIVDEHRIYYFGIMSAEKQKEMENAAERQRKYYASTCSTFIP